MERTGTLEHVLDCSSLGIHSRGRVLKRGEPDLTDIGCTSSHLIADAYYDCDLPSLEILPA